MQLFMKRKTRIGLMAVLLVSGVLFGRMVNCEAAMKLNKSVEKSFFFTVPEGGCSSCRVHVVYTEYYNTSHGKNTFNKRVRWYTASCAYVSAKPVFTIGNVVHKKANGDIIHSFSKWEHEDGLFPGGMEYYGTNKNTGSVTYSTATKNKGMLAYMVTCTGANIPIYTEDVTMKLATN